VDGVEAARAVAVAVALAVAVEALERGPDLAGPAAQEPDQVGAGARGPRRVVRRIGARGVGDVGGEDLEAAIEPHPLELVGGAAELAQVGDPAGVIGEAAARDQAARVVRRERALERAVEPHGRKNQRSREGSW
jgi:hypothetical protein